MRLLLTTLAVSFAILTGCDNAGVVNVSDPAGNPIADAAVVPVSASINGNAGMTDSNGKARISTSSAMQATQLVTVSKTGFVATQAAVPVKWPLRVTLTPIVPATRHEFARAMAKI